jgi:hypothetical protein
MATFVITTPITVSVTSPQVTLANTVNISYDVILNYSMTAQAFNAMFCFDAGNERGWKTGANFTQVQVVNWLLTNYVTTPSDSPAFVYDCANYLKPTGTFPPISSFKVDLTSPNSYLSTPGEGDGTLGYDYASYMYSKIQGNTSTQITTNKYSSLPDYVNFINSIHTQIDASLNSIIITNASSGYPQNNLALTTPKSFNTNPPVVYQIGTQLYKNYPTRFFDTSNNWINVTGNKFGLALPGDVMIFPTVNLVSSSTQKNIFNSLITPTTRKYLLRITCT